MHHLIANPFMEPDLGDADGGREERIIEGPKCGTTGITHARRTVA
jgi:hypothetical protein